MDLKTVRGPEEHDDAYHYHATSAENAHGIAETGLHVHGPSYGTDQGTWPDRSREKRVYFARATNAHQFAPENGRPVLLRVRKDAHPFRRESTGDHYTTAKVPPHKIEYLHESGEWKPMASKGDVSKSIQIGKRPEAPDWHKHTAVRGEDGAPLKVYRGTTAGDQLLSRYRPNEQVGFGFHFTHDRALAERYAHDPNTARRGSKPFVHEGHLDIRKPLHADNIATEHDPDFKVAEHLLGHRKNLITHHWEMPDGTHARAVHVGAALNSTSPQRAERILREHGYDGVHYKSQVLSHAGAPGQFRLEHEAPTWVALDKHQFHSAAKPGDVAKDVPTNLTGGLIEVPKSTHPVKVLPPKAKRREHAFTGFIDFQGLAIDVENKVGETRSGVDGDGKPWSVVMLAHYGEIRNTEGTDGDKLDVYVGPNHDASGVVVIHQHCPSTGAFDEDKVMLGFDSIEEAIGAYKKQYDRPGFYHEGDYEAMPIGAFWRWVHDKRNSGKKVEMSTSDTSKSLCIGARPGVEKGEALIGGRADGMKPEDFDQEALAEATAHEREHTSDEKTAREIAMDHLAEDPNYYRKLAKMEGDSAEKGLDDRSVTDIGARPKGDGVPSSVQRLHSRARSASSHAEFWSNRANEAEAGAIVPRTGGIYFSERAIEHRDKPTKEHEYAAEAHHDTADTFAKLAKVAEPHDAAYAGRAREAAVSHLHKAAAHLKTAASNRAWAGDWSTAGARRDAAHRSIDENLARRKSSIAKPDDVAKAAPWWGGPKEMPRGQMTAPGRAALSATSNADKASRDAWNEPTHAHAAFAHRLAADMHERAHGANDEWDRWHSAMADDHVQQSKSHDKLSGDGHAEARMAPPAPTHPRPAPYDRLAKDITEGTMDTLQLGKRPDEVEKGKAHEYPPNTVYGMYGVKLGNKLIGDHARMHDAALALTKAAHEKTPKTVSEHMDAIGPHLDAALAHGESAAKYEAVYGSGADRNLSRGSVIHHLQMAKYHHDKATGKIPLDQD